MSQGNGKGLHAIIVIHNKKDRNFVINNLPLSMKLMKTMNDIVNNKIIKNIIEKRPFWLYNQSLLQNNYC